MRKEWENFFQKNCESRDKNKNLFIIYFVTFMQIFKPAHGELLTNFFFAIHQLQWRPTELGIEQSGLELLRKNFMILIDGEWLPDLSTPSPALCSLAYSLELRYPNEED